MDNKEITEMIAEYVETIKKLEKENERLKDLVRELENEK